MKKYFMAGTDDELQFGDVISIEFYKELEDGDVTRNLECKFTEVTVDYLLGLGVIEERDPEENDLLNFEENSCEFEEAIQHLLENQASFEERLSILENKINKMKKESRSNKK